MLALSSTRFTPSHAAEHGEDAELVSLGVQLEQRKRDVRRLHGQWQQNGTDRAWQQWSDGYSGLAELCDRIARVEPTTMQGVAIRFDALAVGLLDDDVIMDEGIRRQAALLRLSPARLVQR